MYFQSKKTLYLFQVNMKLKGAENFKNNVLNPVLSKNTKQAVFINLLKLD